MDKFTITERIDSLLKEKGIPKQDFYSDCKITSAAFSQWNTGKTAPRTASLKRISEYLQVNYEYLITGLGPKEKESPLTVSSEGATIDVSDLNADNQEKVKEYIALLLNAQRTEQP